MPVNEDEFEDFFRQGTTQVLLFTWAQELLPTIWARNIALYFLHGFPQPSECSLVVFYCPAAKSERMLAGERYSAFWQCPTEGQKPHSCFFSHEKASKSSRWRWWASPSSNYPCKHQWSSRSEDAGQQTESIRARQSSSRYKCLGLAQACSCKCISVNRAAQVQRRTWFPLWCSCNDLCNIICNNAREYT